MDKMKNKSVVSYVPVKNNDVYLAVKTAMELADWESYFDFSKPAAVKPNWGWDLLFPGSVTSPAVLEAVIKTLKTRTDNIIVIEANQVLESADLLFKYLKIEKLCRKYNISFFNMTRGNFTVKHIKNIRLKEIRYSEIVFRTNLLNVPVMKTHNKTTISGALKNLWGCMDIDRHKYHPEVNEIIPLNNEVISPVFAVMDCISSLEGNGPKTGNPVFTNFIMASPDMVSIDSAAASVMGYNPEKIKHIVKSEENSLGSINFKWIKKDEKIVIPEFHFKNANHNFVSIIELLCRKYKFLNFMLTNKYVFKVNLVFAKIWYRIWYFFKGQRIVYNYMKTYRPRFFGSVK